MLGEGVDVEYDANWVWAGVFQRYIAHAHLLPQATGVPAVMKGVPANPHLLPVPGPHLLPVPGVMREVGEAESQPSLRQVSC